MASVGKFYPFNRYVQDIALMLDGTHKIFPSKFVLLNSLEDGWNTPIDEVQSINSIIEQFAGNNTLESVNYNRTRKEVMNKIKSTSGPQDVNTQVEATDSKYNQYISGDITFLSHDVYNGMIYNEIYIHVSPEDGKHRVVIDNSNGLVSGLLDASIGDASSFEFKAVLLTYNIYNLGSSIPFAKDIPLGIFILNDPQTLTMSSDGISSNTSWSTRICSRFVSSVSAQIENVLNTGSSDYSSMTKLLAKFGEVIESIERANGARQSDMLTIKQYLDDFKRQQTVNVPYLIGDVWYVNGRPASQLDEYISVIQDALNDYVVDAVTEEVINDVKGHVDDVIQELVNEAVMATEDPVDPNPGSQTVDGDTMIHSPRPGGGDVTVIEDPDDPNVEVDS